MAPTPWGEWSMALSHLALGVVSLHAALSTAQVSTQGLGRESPKDLASSWAQGESGERCLESSFRETPEAPPQRKGRCWPLPHISPPCVDRPAEGLLLASCSRPWLPPPCWFQGWARMKMVLLEPGWPLSLACPFWPSTSTG